MLSSYTAQYWQYRCFITGSTSVSVQAVPVFHYRQYLANPSTGVLVHVVCTGWAPAHRELSNQTSVGTHSRELCSSYARLSVFLLLLLVPT